MPCKRNLACRITRTALIYFHGKNTFQPEKKQNRKLSNLHPRYNKNKLSNPF